MNKLPYGYFIVIEGCDGAGKSTISKMLEEKLNKDGYETIYTREPGGIKVGEEIRNIVKNNKLTEIEYLLLFAASMSMNINQIINPALEEKKIIICDRFVRSTYIYQGFAKQNRNEYTYEYIIRKNIFNTIEKYACYGMAPDLELILDINPKIAWERTHIRNEATDVFEDQGYKALENRANLYLNSTGDELFYRTNDCQLIHVDANRDVDKVFEDCYNHIINMIKKDIEDNYL